MHRQRLPSPSARRRTARAATRAAGAACAVVLLLPAGAAAHGTPEPGSTEAETRRAETRTLGARHAAEHATQRAALRRWAARPASERARIAARSRRASTRAAAADAGSPDEVGRWTSQRIDLPTWAINAVLLPTGKVAYWGRGAIDEDGRRPNSAPFYLFDPATNSSEQFDPPHETIDADGDGQADDVAPAPLFCSGQSLLPSGELYVAGGNAFYPDYGEGHADFGGWNGTYSFDPWTERWTVQPRMRHGRWYPTQVELPDGQIGIASGFDEHGEGADNTQFEVFTPAAERGGVGTLAHAPAADRKTHWFYPHMQVLPGGKVAFAGPYRTDSRTLDPGALGSSTPGGAWTDAGPTASYARIGGAAALLPGTSRMLFAGGYGADWDTAASDRIFSPATKTVETADFAAARPTWSTGRAGDVPDMNVARSYGTLVGLPDGGFVYVGGAAGFDSAEGGAGNNASSNQQQLKTVELWRPGAPAWRTGPAQAKWRGYHSTAVLLPDGRVLSAGDDYWGMDDTPHRGAASPQDQGEIYEPAYLFDGAEKAPRPSIASGPAAVGWGDAFALGVDEVPGRRIVRATLIAPTAVTHAADMNRAFVDLPVLDRVAGRGVTVRAPSGPDVAPPGWYMLFAWDETGTPSVARWVQVKGNAPQAPIVPGGGTSEVVRTPPSAPTPGPSPAPPPGPTARDVRGPRVALAVRRPARRARVLRLRVGADEPGRIVVRIRVGRGPQRTRTVRLTSARLGTTLRIPLGVAARRTLRAGRPLRVVLRTEGRDGVGNASRSVRTVRVRPTR